jgi:hypothetical protein
MSCNCSEGECLHSESGDCECYALFHPNRTKKRELQQQQMGSVVITPQKQAMKDASEESAPFTGESFGGFE